MKVSVVIIAHNEEEHIAACITSILSQTLRPDEVIVISHNSTDRTAEIANSYPVTVVPYQGPAGSHYARIRGFEAASGHVVLCIDGDSTAARNWAETLTHVLAKPGTVLAGSWVRMRGTLLIEVACLRWFFHTRATGMPATDFLFGASFGIRGEHRAQAIEALRKGAVLSEELKLPANPDDYWLALFFNTLGTVEVTNRTWVLATAKERTSWQSLTRSLESYAIRAAILRHLSRHTLSL